MLKRCKFCGVLDKSYAGYCQKCYTYFCINQYKNYKDKVRNGELSIVDDKNDKQFGMRICHICGNAYIKLQSHIYHSHHISKNEYCDKFGLDRKTRMTTDIYNRMMHDYALLYKMDEQLKRVGQKTRFQKGVSNKYERSYMTKERLRNYGKEMGHKNLKEFKEKI